MFLRSGGDLDQTEGGINSQELDLICFEHRIDGVSNRKMILMPIYYTFKSVRFRKLTHLVAKQTL